VAAGKGNALNREAFFRFLNPFGTDLPAARKDALLEYLKTL
jgi:hypothetical protein